MADAFSPVRDFFSRTPAYPDPNNAGGAGQSIPMQNTGGDGAGGGAGGATGGNNDGVTTRTRSADLWPAGPRRKYQPIAKAYWKGCNPRFWKMDQWWKDARVHMCFGLILAVIAIIVVGSVCGLGYCSPGGDGSSTVKGPEPKKRWPEIWGGGSDDSPYGKCVTHKDFVDLEIFCRGVKEIPIIYPRLLTNVSLLLWRHNIGWTRLTKPVFDSYPNLLRISLINCSIEIIEKDTFSGVSNLEELDISNNKISKLSVETFANLTKLLVLYLSDNNLMQIHPDLLLSNTKLRKLELIGNQLTVLEDGTFANMNLNKVRRIGEGIAIVLDNNKLIEISPKVFGPREDDRYITILSLTKNPVNIAFCTSVFRLNQTFNIYALHAPPNCSNENCIFGDSSCDGYANCTNFTSLGHTICDCEYTHKYNPSTHMCENINECEGDPWPCRQDRKWVLCDDIEEKPGYSCRCIQESSSDCPYSEVTNDNNDLVNSHRIIAAVVVAVVVLLVGGLLIYLKHNQTKHANRSKNLSKERAQKSGNKRAKPRTKRT